jgi:K+-sensing histidine kinase KdpD
MSPSNRKKPVKPSPPRAARGVKKPPAPHTATRDGGVPGAPAFMSGIEKRLAQIRLISDVAGRLAANLEIQELLNTAASTIQKTFDYFDVTVFLLTEGGKLLDLSAHAGNFTDFLPHGYQQPVEKGIVGMVARTGETLLANDVSLQPGYLSYEYHDTRSEIALPIKIDGRVIGVLNVEDTRLDAFDQTDALVLSTLSDQLGIAIRNAGMYEELRQANMKLIELDTMKSEFLGIVSHDFRSPLSSIMLAARSLLKNEAVQSIPRAKEYMQLIVDQAVRLNQLAEDTLSITKMEAGQLTYYFKIVNMERLIQDAASMVRFSKRHDFEYSVDPDALFVKGDQTKLRQVLQNLVNNAVKYSPQGGKVSVRVENRSSEEIMVSVSDQGIGVPKEKLGKLFQKFSRVDSKESKEIKGAGLGLWICREVVGAHGGTIWMESEPGKGSTVRFIIRRTPEGA